MRQSMSPPLVWLAILLSCAVRPAAGQTGAPAGEWRTYGGDLASTRYAPLDEITAGNFAALELAWRFNQDELGPSRATPLMVDGVLYFTGAAGRPAVAVDAATGQLLWSHHVDEGERARSAPIPTSRGLAYWRDGNEARILYVTLGYQLVALDAASGRPDAAFGRDGIVDLKRDMDQAIDPVTGEVGLTAAPIVVGDVIVIGAMHAPGAAPRSRTNVKGYIRGYDVRTGERLWIFHTIPQPGEFGNETWLDDSWSYTGNTGVWAQMSADAELGLVYLPVELPTGDYYGGHRPGDNLFSESIVAVDVRTGERRWHYQLVHHGLLGLRHSLRADSGRHHGRRPSRQGAGAAVEAGLAVRARPGDRRAGLAHRGAAGAAGRRARGVVFAHATVRDPAARIRAPGRDA